MGYSYSVLEDLAPKPKPVNKQKPQPQQRQRPRHSLVVEPATKVTPTVSTVIRPVERTANRALAQAIADAPVIDVGLTTKTFSDDPMLNELLESIAKVYDAKTMGEKIKILSQLNTIIEGEQQ